MSRESDIINEQNRRISEYTSSVARPKGKGILSILFQKRLSNTNTASDTSDALTLYRAVMYPKAVREFAAYLLADPSKFYTDPGWPTVDSIQLDPVWSTGVPNSLVQGLSDLLAGKETAGAAAAAQAFAIQRSNHTGTQSASTVTGLATVATSGAYNDLSGKPTIPAAQVQADYAQANTGAVDFIKNKPTLGTAATQNVGAFATAAQGTKADNAATATALSTEVSDRIAGDNALQAQVTAITTSLAQPRSILVWQQTGEVTVGNTTSELTLIGTGKGSIALPANFLTEGCMFTLQARGVYSTGLVASLLGTLTIRAKIDSVVMGVATLNMTNFAASMSNKGWAGRGDTVFRGITGSNILGNTSGVINYIGAGPTAITEEFINNSASVDRTVPHNLNVTAQFSIASPSNSVKVTQLNFWYTPPPA